jgi:hypothetical protein
MRLTHQVVFAVDREHELVVRLVLHRAELRKQGDHIWPFKAMRNRVPVNGIESRFDSVMRSPRTGPNVAVILPNVAVLSVMSTIASSAVFRCKPMPVGDSLWQPTRSSAHQTCGRDGLQE